ncbi:CHAT domain-containing protein [Mongoliitalea lutea]|uniref:CHAT domain-containing protein n=1 Tax=Mongoliitalea lutea TaxID=849756 RepID=UPI001E643F7A|nr:CHAT domain-containing tetratricopeptide repeat protein [Mongoliitalea lutea]
MIEKITYEELMQKGEYKQALELAISYLNSLDPAKDLSNERAAVLKDLGLIHIELENYVKAVDYLRQAVKILQDYPAADLSLLALAHNDLAYSVEMIGNSIEGMYHYERAFELWYNNYFDDIDNLTTSFSNIRHTFIQYGDLKKASIYMEKFTTYAGYVESVLKNDRAQLVKFKIKYLHSKISYEATLLSTNEALLSWHELVAYFPETKKYNLKGLDGYFLASLEALGYMFKTTGNYEQSIFFYKQMSQFNPSSFFVMKMNANISIALHNDKKYKQALEYCLKALEYFENNKFGTSELTLNIIQSELLFWLGDYDKSKQLLVNVFSEWTAKPLQLKDLQRLDLSDLGGKNNPFHIDILIKAGYIFFELSLIPGNETLREISFNLYCLAARSFENYYLKEAYNPALAYTQNSISEGLFRLMAQDKSFEESYLKSVVQQLEIIDSQHYLKEFLSKNAENLSGDLEFLKQKNDLSIAINYLSQVDDSEENLELVFRKNQLQQVNNKITSIRNQNLQFINSGVDLSEIQGLLKSSDQMIKYYVTKSDVFGLKVSKDALSIKNLGKTSLIIEELNTHKACLGNPKCNPQATAKRLHDWLIAPLDLRAKENLIFIPNGELHFIPMETLMDANSELLVKKHAISYAHSLKHVSVQKSLKAPKKSKFLVAYAPNYLTNKFSGIKNNQKEALEIASQMKGDFLIGPEADKASFLANLTNYQVQHLALHAEQDPFTFENSSLIFSNEERLYFHELYKLNFPADLVVLSACNSGIGSLEPGEGIMGLGKALSFAGAFATVYSLWAVPDKETELLMSFFYQFLKEGKFKDEALRLAKLTFIEKFPLKSHPYFWAGFVLNGSSEPIQKQDRFPLILLSSFLLLLAVYYYIVKKRKKNQRSF